MLQRIQALLQQKGPLSLAALAQMLGSDPETVRPMLELLVRKGRVVRAKRATCGECLACRPEELEMYSYKSVSNL